MKFDEYKELHKDKDEVWACLVHFTDGAKRPQKLLEPTKCYIKDWSLYDSKGKHIVERTTDYQWVDVFDNEVDCQFEFYKQSQTAMKMVGRTKEELQKRLDRLGGYIATIEKNYPEAIV